MNIKIQINSFKKEKYKIDTMFIFLLMMGLICIFVSCFYLTCEFTNFRIEFNILGMILIATSLLYYEMLQMTKKLESLKRK